MRLVLKNAPWHDGERAKAWDDVDDILLGSWREAANDFYAERLVRVAAGKKAPKGIQSFLNDVLDRRFIEAGWEGEQGRFWVGECWCRITFRHQMSLGSDFLDALKVHARSGFRDLAIIGATRSFLSVITPNDAAAIASHEKLWTEALDLNGCFDVPLLIGRLDPASALPPEVAAIVNGGRPRDVYVPGMDSS